MSVVHSRKQATIKKDKEGKEEILDAEEDSRLKSYSTLLYEDKVSLFGNYYIIASGEVELTSD